MLVEDEEFLRKLYRLLLEEMGLAVEVCTDGEQALEFIRNDRAIDLLITDIKMPRLDGFQLYDAVREIFEELPVIMISGFADQKKIRSYSTPDNVGYLQKPFTDNELKEAIEKLLG